MQASILRKQGPINQWQSASYSIEEVFSIVQEPTVTGSESSYNVLKITEPKPLKIMKQKTKPKPDSQKSRKPKPASAHVWFQ